MSIRREDKELIHNLAVLGALLGICLGVFVVVNLSSRAHEQDRQFSEYQQTHAALAKLSSPKDAPGELVVDPAIIQQMQEQIRAQQPEYDNPPKSVWLRIPRWGFWGICGGAGLLGAAAGFATIWLTGWAGSVFIYYFIRGLYKIIRKVAPNSAAARSAEHRLQPCDPITVRRDDSRILPTVIKLLFLLALVLGLLGIVVWHLAGM